MDLSLDDIIQKRNMKGAFKGRGGNNRARQQGNRNAPNRTGNVNTTQNKKFINKRNTGGVASTGRVNTGRVSGGRVGKVNPAPRIIDARQKIIQKNRQKLTDAREKLGEIAKQTDARLKLEKLRVSRQTGRLPLQTGRLPLQTGRLSLQAGRLPLPVGNARLPGRRNNDVQLRRNTQIPLQRTIRQAVGTVVVPNNWYRSTLGDMDVDMDIDEPLPGVSQVLRRTIANEQANSRQSHRQSSYSSWQATQHRAQREPEPVSRGYVDPDYPSEDRMRVKPQANVSLTNRWSGRTSNPAPSQNSSMKHRTPGYRIVISNLHTSVIHEDIQELFEDVGPLLESRLVRPGTAEVVFKLLSDAEKAVDLYHNRQLDGQPMKCMLVNARPSGSTPPPSHSHSTSRSMTAALGRSAKVASGSKSAIVPDISTIHKALFNRS